MPSRREYLPDCAATLVFALPLAAGLWFSREPHALLALLWLPLAFESWWQAKIRARKRPPLELMLLASWLLALVTMGLIARD